MGFVVKNRYWSLTMCLNLLKFYGFLVPGKRTGKRKMLLRIYWIFWYTFLNGIYIIVQAGDLLQIWGDLPLMVSTSFLLFTNIALGIKIINVVLRGEAIQAIINEGDEELHNEYTIKGEQIIESSNRECTQQLYVYYFLSGVTVLGWAASAEKNCLPLRAWYPYDTSTFPAYQITYFHQITVLLLAAPLNISLDTLATSLIGVCRCRLKLLDLSLRSLCANLNTAYGNDLKSDEQEKILISRLNVCVRRHQTALYTAKQIQKCFGEPILTQFTVSMVIICVTAYQVASELNSTSKNVVHIVAMTAYLLCMTLQVFLYCYQGNQLSIESSELASAAYHCSWYLCSLRFRRSLLLVMIRSKKEAKIIASGFTTLSLAAFTAIIKASYTFFTVLDRVEDRRK